MSLQHDALAGLLVGFLVGMTGMGGSSLMAPILIYLFHFKAKFAIGSDLAYAAIAKIFGAWQHKKAGTVNMKLVTQLAMASVPSSLLGVWAVHSIDKHFGESAERILTRLLGAMLIIVSATLIARSVPRIEEWFNSHREYPKEHSLVVSLIVGAIGGFLVGLTSIGAGTLFGVALILVFGQRPRETVGTDIYHGCILAVAAAAGHVVVGDVDFPLVGSLLIGAIPGVLLGGLMSTRLPERALRPALATVLLLSGLRILF
jgi:uncharacterized protein